METQVQASAAVNAAGTSEATKLSQKDAVTVFITEALKGVTVPEGVKLKDLVTKDVRKVVRQRLFNGFKAGEIKLGKTYDDSKLKKYCSGLINNWLKKDNRFN